MMPRAHIGVATAGAWMTRRKVDYRLVAFGAVLPDIIDTPFNLLLFPGEMAGWLVGHCLLFNVVLVLLGIRFRWALVLGLASMSHVLLDRVWRAPTNFYWPFLNWAFERHEGVSVWQQMLAHFGDPATWKAELVAGISLVIALAGVLAWRRMRNREGGKSFRDPAGWSPLRSPKKE